MLKFITIAVSLSLVGATPLTATATVHEQKFSNCSALNKVYPGGVAKSKSSKNKGGETKLKPVISAKIYDENRSKDRDKDRIACER